MPVLSIMPKLCWKSVNSSGERSKEGRKEERVFGCFSRHWEAYLLWVFCIKQHLGAL